MVQKQILGHLGEKLAVKYLSKQGYAIRQTNYHAREGEIDIIAEKDGIVHFIEVKARSNDSFGLPEDAIDDYKLEKILKTGYQYIDRYNLDGDWQIDVVSIRLDRLEKQASIDYFQNIG